MVDFTRFKAPELLPYPVDCAVPDIANTPLLAKQWWARAYKGSVDTQMAEHKQLITHILRFGGYEVCMGCWEHDLEQLLHNGEFLYGAGAQLRPMRASECHANSATLWRCSEVSLDVMTGYALTVDGIWRQHSWCLDRSTGQPIETTTARLAYYGIVLSDAEANAFYRANSFMRKFAR